MTRLFTCGVLLVGSGLVAQAHHSIAGMYDSSRRVTVEGTVAQFHFVNPHPFVLLDVTDAGGKPRQWRLELDNRRELVDIGVKEDTLRYGAEPTTFDTIRIPSSSSMRATTGASAKPTGAGWRGRIQLYTTPRPESRTSLRRTPWQRLRRW